jgi:hypothetical protein
VLAADSGLAPATLFILQEDAEDGQKWSRPLGLELRLPGWD